MASQNTPKQVALLFVEVPANVEANLPDAWPDVISEFEIGVMLRNAGFPRGDTLAEAVNKFLMYAPKATAAMPQRPVEVVVARLDLLAEAVKSIDWSRFDVVKHKGLHEATGPLRGMVVPTSDGESVDVEATNEVKNRVMMGQPVPVKYDDGRRLINAVKLYKFVVRRDPMMLGVFLTPKGVNPTNNADWGNISDELLDFAARLGNKFGVNPADVPDQLRLPIIQWPRSIRNLWDQYVEMSSARNYQPVDLSWMPEDGAPTASVAPAVAAVANSAATVPTNNIQEVVSALQSAFSRGELERISLFAINVHLDHIASNKLPYPDAVFLLVNWAIAKGKIKDLLDYARKENPGNKILAYVANQYNV